MRACLRARTHTKNLFALRSTFSCGKAKKGLELYFRFLPKSPGKHETATILENLRPAVSCSNGADFFATDEGGKGEQQQKKNLERFNDPAKESFLLLLRPNGRGKQIPPKKVFPLCEEVALSLTDPPNFPPFFYLHRKTWFFCPLRSMIKFHQSAFWHMCS